VRLHKSDEQAEKILTLWLNSTLGLLMSVAHRVPTEGSWVKFKKPNIENLPVLNVQLLSAEQKKQLSGAYDTLSTRTLDTIANMATDTVRGDIDRALATVLGLPSIETIRNELAREPVICGRQMDYEPLPDADTQLQFELI
jgi:hypothetical protein